MTNNNNKITVRQLIEHNLKANPGVDFDFMTPGGYVYIRNEDLPAILADPDYPIVHNAGCSGVDMKIEAKYVLDMQYVCGYGEPFKDSKSGRMVVAMMTE